MFTLTRAGSLKATLWPEERGSRVECLVLEVVSHMKKRITKRVFVILLCILPVYLWAYWIGHINREELVGHYKYTWEESPLQYLDIYSDGTYAITFSSDQEIMNKWPSYSAGEKISNNWIYDKSTRSISFDDFPSVMMYFIKRIDFSCSVNRRLSGTLNIMILEEDHFYKL